MTLPTEFPDKHGDLYDLLQQMFGIGSWDEATSDVPWFKARMGEVVRLKALCNSRRVTPRQVAIAAWYAKDRGIQVRTAHRLLPLVPEAMAAYNQARRDQDAAAGQEELAEAISDAIENGRSDWADRLLRATPEEVPNLLKKWRAAR